ncbi:cellulase family glycosylhydrolase [Chloroflexia bacterium SDU3-3]|nr:cellulase family glycosylhydrolase [Chloroflexia bacterium SDU3-3]
MSKRRIKLLIWLAVALVGLALAAALVRGAASLLASFQRGADPASALHIVPNIAPDIYVDMRWLDDDANVGRTIDPVARADLQNAYLRGWLQWGFSYTKGEPFGLKSYFTGPALAAVGGSVSAAAADGLRIDQVDTSHHMRLHFYSANGALASFTDHDVVVAQVIRDTSGRVVYAGETRADYDVVMVLEDGSWRVRHMVRRSAGKGWEAPTPAPACPGCASVAGARLLVGGQPYTSHGVNYYPQATPWDLFWSTYSTGVIDRDLSRMKGMGLNTVRIFIPYEQFGGPQVDPQKLGLLSDFLGRAHAQGIMVVVTLFDFRADYGTLRWPDADAHMRTLLTSFAASPAILAWDLKNEPDLDYARSGRELVDAWLAHAADMAHHYDPNHPITIGWSSPQAAQSLVEKVDLIQFHYYATAEAFPAAYVSLRAAAQGKPIVLGEFGLPTWNSVFPHGHTEAEQAAYYADMLAALRQTDSAGFMAWTLYDFTAVPASVAGGMPWQVGPQRQLGLLRADGGAKPAAALLAPGAALDVPRPPAWARFAKPFWLAVVLGALLIGALSLWGLRRIRRALPWRATPRLPPAERDPAPAPARQSAAQKSRARRRTAKRKRRR